MTETAVLPDPGDKPAVARALAALEVGPRDPGTLALLETAWRAPRAHVLGLTGPPGVGKSTLTGALIRALRANGETVAVIAVDPSSRRSGGALLGDRTRLATDPGDDGVFVRSMAARDRLGGLADLTVAAVILMRAIYDVVLVETVGVGQSETDVVGVADTVLFCVQPGSGDSLQFMKAGIVEIPHVVAVTKADMGPEAERARADVTGALGLAAGEADATWAVPVLLVSASRGEGLKDLLDAIRKHWAHLNRGETLRESRARQARSWVRESIRDRFGAEGLRVALPILDATQDPSPFAALSRAEADLSARLQGGG